MSVKSGKMHSDEESEKEESARLELFSDAMFSVIATINVLPSIESLKEASTFENEIGNENGNGFTTVSNFLGVYGVFALVYTLIAVQVRLHNALFEKIEKNSAVFIGLNFIYFAILSFLPFANDMIIQTSHIGVQYGAWFPPLFHSSVMFFSSFTQWIMFIWMWKVSSPNDKSAYYYLVNNTWSLVINFCACILTIAVGILYPPAALGAYTTVFMGWLIRGAFDYFLVTTTYSINALCLDLPNALFTVYGQKKPEEKESKTKEINQEKADTPPLVSDTITHSWGSGIIMKQASQQLEALQLTEKAENKSFSLLFAKERLETFSDGIFAIAITLIAVNLRSPPHQEIIEVGALYPLLAKMWTQYAAHFVTFSLAGVQWYFHQKMIKATKMIDLIIFISNMIYLFFIASLPLFIQASIVFSTTNESEISTLFFCSNLIGIGLSQIHLWFQINRSKYKDVQSSLFIKRNNRLMYYLTSTVVIASIATLLIGYFIPHLSLLLFLVLWLVCILFVIILNRGGFRRYPQAPNDQTRLLDLLHKD